MIEHHDDDSVSFRITAFSRPATRLARIAGPLGAVVQRQITAAYEARTRTLDLGRSAVTLPHSRVEFSGAIGRELRVHLETRDLIIKRDALQQVEMAGKAASAII